MPVVNVRKNCEDSVTRRSAGLLQNNLSNVKKSKREPNRKKSKKKMLRRIESLLKISPNFLGSELFESSVATLLEVEAAGNGTTLNQFFRFPPLIGEPGGHGRCPGFY